MCKQLDFDNLGRNINGENLFHLRFADDILYIKNSRMTNLIIGEGIYLDGKQVEETRPYKYLIHEICIRTDNQTCDLIRKVGLTLAAFGKWNFLIKADLPMCQKRKVFHQCVLPVLTSETLTKKTVNRIRVRQRSMERLMLRLSLRDKVPNKEIRRRRKFDGCSWQTCNTKMELGWSYRESHIW